MKLGGGAAGADFGGRMKKRPSFRAGARIKGHYDIICRRPDGSIKWTDTIENLVVNTGLDHLLDVTLSGGSQDTSWFIGLTDGTPTVAAGDTLASHAGWTEVEAYDEATREAFVDGGVSGQSVDNSASPAEFTIDTNATTIGGAFLAADGTKGGTTGILYSVGAFTGGDKSADDGDTLEVTATFTMADDGA